MHCPPPSLKLIANACVLRVTPLLLPPGIKLDTATFVCMGRKVEHTMPVASIVAAGGILALATGVTGTSPGGPAGARMSQGVCAVLPRAHAAGSLTRVVGRLRFRTGVGPERQGASTAVAAPGCMLA